MPKKSGMCLLIFENQTGFHFLLVMLKRMAYNIGFRIDRSVQEWRIAIANALELRLPCTDPSIYWVPTLFPENTVPVANMGPTWVLSAPSGPHVGPRNLAIWAVIVIAALCPAGYTHFPGYHCYRITTTAQTWEDSLSLCQDEGSSLVALETPGEYAALRPWIIEQGETSMRLINYLCNRLLEPIMNCLIDLGGIRWFPSEIRGSEHS